MFNGDLDQSIRNNILSDFREGNISVLITTDLATRGIDIPGVAIVVNYDVPELPENYVHRCGRTGRGKEKGFAISFCSENETELIEDIEAYTGENIIKYEITGGEYDQIKWDTEDINYDWQKLIDESNNTDKDEW